MLRNYHGSKSLATDLAITYHGRPEYPPASEAQIVILPETHPGIAAGGALICVGVAHLISSPEGYINEKRKTSEKNKNKKQKQENISGHNNIPK